MTSDQLTSLLLIHPDSVSVVVELAKTITRESAKIVGYDADQRAAFFAVQNVARDVARDAEWDTAWETTGKTVWNAAGEAFLVEAGFWRSAASNVDGDEETVYAVAQDAAGWWSAARDAVWLAGACVVRDLITHDQLHVLVEAFHRHLPEEASLC